MKRLTVLILALVSILPCRAKEERAPRFVNIVNFIRQVEPRRPGGIEDELYQATAEEIRVMQEYGLKGTFLLQYDALINPKYQRLMKEDLPAGSEVGGWWEITEPHVRAAGMEWRGRFPWDWHANVGFATGYTPEEREKLVDVYMEKFKEVFGYLPKSVGSWFIDAHTLGYMYDRYGIVASCNCKDQWGTDGYTMWGGYWNQAYYPSKVNAFMPAQTRERQIPVPVFRMLGSDPVYQYDNGMESHFQGVVTLEPVYTGGEGGGGVKEWVDWYLPMIADGECLAFNYVQAGQENSFTWERIQKGFELQMPVIKKLVDEGRLTISTLAESGEWFKSNFKFTPPTSVVAEDDFLKSGKASIWYDSRYYRANLYWDGDSFRFRDIHLFDERMESDYLRMAGTSTKCVYTTLPVVDGYLWSTPDKIAGLRLMHNGQEVKVDKPAARKSGNGTLIVEAETSIGKMSIKLFEDKMEFSVKSRRKDWILELTVAPDAAPSFKLPSAGRQVSAIYANERGYPYNVRLDRGWFTRDFSRSHVWSMVPDNGTVILNTRCR